MGVGFSAVDDIPLLEPSGEDSTISWASNLLEANELKSIQFVARQNGQSVITKASFMMRLRGIPADLKFFVFQLFTNHTATNKITFGELVRGVVSCCKLDRATRMLFFVRMFVPADSTVVTTKEAREMVCMMFMAASQQSTDNALNSLSEDAVLDTDWEEVRFRSDTEFDVTTVNAETEEWKPQPLDIDAVYQANKVVFDALLWQINDEKPPTMAHIAGWLAQRVPRFFEIIEQSVYLGFLGAIRSSAAKADSTSLNPSPAAHVQSNKRTNSPPSSVSNTAVPAILAAPAEVTSAAAAVAALASAAGTTNDPYTRPFDKPVGLEAILMNSHVPALENRLEGSFLTETWAWLISSCIDDTKYSRFEPWRLLYTANTHGFSLTSFERRACDYPGATLLIVQDLDGLVSAAFLPEGWKASKGFRPMESTVLFDLLPRFDANATLPGGDRNHVYFSNTGTKMFAAGIGFGGQVGNFRLWIDGSLQTGYRYYEKDTSFIQTLLPNAGPKKPFSVAKLEVWGLGGNRAANYQQGQKKWEDRQVEKAQTAPRTEWAIDRMILEMAGRPTYNTAAD